MKRFIVVLLAVCSLFLYACGSSGGGGGDDSTNGLPNLSGTWSGTWQSDTSKNGNVNMNITQNNNSFAGTANITKSPCFNTGDISGSISESSITFGLISGNDEVAYVANYTATTVNGSYQVLSGACAGDTGDFNLNKQ